MSLLTTYIERFNHVQALCIGDIMLDRFLYGTVERISPEAPVPIFKLNHEKQMLGGAGNVVANMTALGCRVTFIGIVGNDENGERISSLLRKAKAHAHLLKLENYPTIVKTRLIAGSNHLMRVDQEEQLPVFEALLPKFEKILIQAIRKVDVVVLSDYNKGLLTPVTTQMIINVCHQFNKPVIIDPKGNDYSKYIRATIVKPNLKEFSEATHQKYNPQDKNFLSTVQNNALSLFNKFKIKNLLITLSEYGMLFVPSNANEECLQIPTEAKEVYDVSGAGDTSLATLGAAIGCGVPVKEAMKLANLASGIVVGKLGTATVSAEELRTALSSKENLDNEWFQKKKIISLSQAEEIVSKLRETGKKIGFTNGCFDCCHLGHLNSFMQAKRLCDILIVAVNSDNSVKRDKGHQSPIQDEKTRSMLLASLEFIDYVIVFEEDSPLHIVETLKPDVIAKEGSTLETWPEGKFAQSYGGKAVILSKIEGYSTSSLVQKMKG